MPNKTSISQKQSLRIPNSVTVPFINYSTISWLKQKQLLHKLFKKEIVCCHHFVDSLSANNLDETV